MTNTTYEVISQIDSETGDTIIPIPQELLDQLGWKEGDDITLSQNPDGTIVLNKQSK
jgi:bifunctional DNA-binding transcriptional regulator/antitoxin component of YhaV-PrlF toxin-antitoxin module